MSTALAIAGVTRVILDLLNDGIVNHNVSGVLGTSVTVSLLPPDRVIGNNGSESTQLNLFLHHVSPNVAFRNDGLPARDTTGRTRLSRAPLALDLHYLLTVHSTEPLHAEILCGYALQLLHENSVLDRKAIATALNPSPDVGSELPPALRALSECGLADQVELVKLTPEPFGTDEMSKLWTAVQSHYRLTAAYVASVVLIESALPARAPLPVLTRGPVDPATGRERGVSVQPSLQSLFPSIQSVSLPSGQTSATVGSTVGISGYGLAGSDVVVVLSSSRWYIEQTVAVLSGSSSTSAAFVVPELPAGFYQLAVRLVPPGDSTLRTSNQVPLAIGPVITTALPMSVARDGDGAAAITLDCSPEMRPGQRVSLLLGDQEVMAEPLSAASRTLSFVVTAAPVGTYLVRLRVDGLDSPIIDAAASPPAFLDYRITIA